jgi:hypothetical protein
LSSPQARNRLIQAVNAGHAEEIAIVVNDLNRRTHSFIFVAAVIGAAALSAAAQREASAQAAPKAKAPAAGSKTGAAAPRQPSPPAKAAAPSADESAAREQILNSDKWKQTLAGFDQWLDTQTMYDAQEVQQTKSRLQVGIGRMTAAQLQWFENDLQEKLRILSGEQAQDASEYLAQTLAVASPAYARKLRQKLPDLLTTTAAQVNQQLAAFSTKRQTTQQMQGSFDSARQQEIAFNQSQLAAREQESERALDRAQSAAASAGSKGNSFTPARDYFPHAGNDGPFGPGTSVSFFGGGFF